MVGAPHRRLALVARAGRCAGFPPVATTGHVGASPARQSACARRTAVADNRKKSGGGLHHHRREIGLRQHPPKHAASQREKQRHRLRAAAAASTRPRTHGGNGKHYRASPSPGSNPAPAATIGGQRPRRTRLSATPRRRAQASTEERHGGKRGVSKRK